MYELVNEMYARMHVWMNVFIYCKLTLMKRPNQPPINMMPRSLHDNDSFDVSKEFPKYNIRGTVTCHSINCMIGCWTPNTSSYRLGKKVQYYLIEVLAINCTCFLLLYTKSYVQYNFVYTPYQRKYIHTDEDTFTALKIPHRHSNSELNDIVIKVKAVTWADITFILKVDVFERAVRIRVTWMMTAPPETPVITIFRSWTHGEYPSSLKLKVIKMKCRNNLCAKVRS